MATYTPARRNADFSRQPTRMRLPYKSGVLLEFMAFMRGWKAVMTFHEPDDVAAGILRVPTCGTACCRPAGKPAHWQPGMAAVTVPRTRASEERTDNTVARK